MYLCPTFVSFHSSMFLFYFLICMYVPLYLFWIVNSAKEYKSKLHFDTIRFIHHFAPWPSGCPSVVSILSLTACLIWDSTGSCLGHCIILWSQSAATIHCHLPPAPSALSSHRVVPVKCWSVQGVLEVTHRATSGILAQANQFWEFDNWSLLALVTGLGQPCEALRPSSRVGILVWQHHIFWSVEPDKGFKDPCPATSTRRGTHAHYKLSPTL
jgi:hypothetical protein